MRRSGEVIEWLQANADGTVEIPGINFVGNNNGMYGSDWSVRDIIKFENWLEPALTNEHILTSQERLADAAWHVLDDMGKDGLSCCLAAKAYLRVAFEPFKTLDDPMDMSFEVAQKVLEDVGNKFW